MTRPQGPIAHSCCPAVDRGLGRDAACCHDGLLTLMGFPFSALECLSSIITTRSCRLWGCRGGGPRPTHPSRPSLLHLLLPSLPPSSPLCLPAFPLAHVCLSACSPLPLPSSLACSFGKRMLQRGRTACSEGPGRPLQGVKWEIYPRIDKLDCDALRIKGAALGGPQGPGVAAEARRLLSDSTSLQKKPRLALVRSSPELPLSPPFCCRSQVSSWFESGQGRASLLPRCWLRLAPGVLLPAPGSS